MNYYGLKIDNAELQIYFKSWPQRFSAFKQLLVGKSKDGVRPVFFFDAYFTTKVGDARKDEFGDWLNSEERIANNKNGFVLLKYNENKEQNMSYQDSVKSFHSKYGAVVNTKPTLIDDKSKLLRVRLISEEAAEFASAASKNDMVGMCDALCDLLYVTFGTAVELGVDIKPMFDEVHASNMTKDGGGSDSGGKIVKGPNFKVPDLLKLLKQQGWQE